MIWLMAALWEALSGVPVGDRVEVRDGAAVVASFVPRTPATRRGAPVVRELDAEGHRLLEVRLPLPASPGREEVWLAERGPNGTATLWTGMLGPIDGDGETGRALAVGADGVELYQTAARLRRCDGAPARLFRERWDFAGKRFRAAPPAVPPEAAQVLRARRGDPDMPAGRPMGGFFWTAASSAAGARDAAGLTAPGALNDGDPKTAWTAGGDGRGAWVTARTSSVGASVIGLRLAPAPARAGRPRRVALLLGPADDQRFEIELEDADKPAAPFWVRLPRPVPSSCVTVLIREAQPGAPASIGDLEVVTELDGPDGVARLVEAVRGGTDCESRVALLAGLGDAALGPVIEALRQGPGPGRECLLSALDRLIGVASANPSVAAALVAALDRARPAEEKLVLALLLRLTPPPIAPLAALLKEGRADEERARAVRALAVLEAAAPAREALVAAAGASPPMLRTAVRAHLARMKAPLSASLREALGQSPAPPRRADLLFALGAAAAREPDERAANLRVLRDAAGADDFEAAARAVEALGRLRDGPAVAALAKIRAGSPDPVLRYLATRELASAPQKEALGAVREALDDGDPRVRETAALALGQRRDGSSAGRLVAAAKQEPWPFVRRAEVSALGAMCAAGDLLVRANERDVPEVRREALSGLARCRDPRAATLLLRVLGRRLEDPDLRALSARLLGTLGDRSVARPFAEAVARLRVEAQAELPLEGVTVVAMQSLSRVGGPDAVGAAVALLGDERPLFKRTALEALGQLCDAGPGAQAVQAAVRDRDPAVAAAATAAQRRCRK